MAVVSKTGPSVKYVYDTATVKEPKTLAGRHIRLVENGDETIIYTDTSLCKWFRSLLSCIFTSHYASQEELKNILENISQEQITPEARKIGTFITTMLPQEQKIIETFSKAVKSHEEGLRAYETKSKTDVIEHIKTKFNDPASLYFPLLQQVNKNAYVTAYNTLAQYDALNGNTDKLRAHIEQQVLEGQSCVLDGLNTQAGIVEIKNQLWQNKIIDGGALQNMLIAHIEGKNLPNAKKFDLLCRFGFNWQSKTIHTPQCAKTVIDELFSSRISISQTQKLRKEALQRLNSGAINALFDANSYPPIATQSPLERQIPPLAATGLMQDIDFPQAAIVSFANVDSSKLVSLPIARGQDLSKIEDPRQGCFLKNDPEGKQSALPVIMRSPLVPDQLVGHLLYDKRKKALATKFQPQDPNPITNAEALYSQLRVQLTACHAAGDIIYQGQYSRFSGDTTRPVIVSTNIHPDYEFGSNNLDRAVMWQLTAAGSYARKGEPLPDDFTVLAAQEKRDPEKLAEYEAMLLADLIYHCTEDHLIPALSDIPPENILSQQNAAALFESIIKNPTADIQKELKGKYIQIQGDNNSVHSLEILFSLYVHQLRNEFSGLEATLPQGYVYTIDPPSIFAKAFDAQAMNRLQILGMKHLFTNTPPVNVKVIAFNDNTDKGYLPLLRAAVPETVTVCPKYAQDGGVYKPQEIQTDGGKAKTVPVYNIQQPYALVIHNNDDAFGDNITNEEGFGSLDAVVGALTTAANCLKRQQEAVSNGLCWPPLN